MIRWTAGDLQLSLLDAGTVWLDGGSMFGVVPRVLWEKQRPPDDQHRIRMATNVLLIDDGRRRILVDTGAGTKWDEKGRSIYNLETKSPDDLLAPAGLRPDQIDMVVNTHLHFDHAGGNTVRDGAGRVLPAFPNAEYVVQRGELETAGLDNERIRAAYPPENFEPLLDEGRLRLIEGDIELTGYLRVQVARGHTPFMQMALVTDGGETTAFVTDLVPTASHLPYGWVMGYDLEPLETMACKKRVLPLAARERWVVVFEHDAELPLGKLEQHEGGLRARPAEVGV